MAIFNCKICGNVYQNVFSCCNSPTKNVTHYSPEDKANLNEKISALFGEINLRNPKSHYVIPDIQPYQAMGVDKLTGKAPMITSRREHREFLRRNNYVEIGNEAPPTQKVERDHNVRRELTEATREVLRKYR